jgi:indolepyruvate decarboxylase
MPNVMQFLIERLQNLGIKNVFGGTGTYINNFITEIKNAEINFVETNCELNAGFAADAYARVNGYGCVVADYNTGALKICSSIAMSYAERSPVIVISSSPAQKERNEDFLLHNLVKSFDNQFEIFKYLTCHSVILSDSSTAGYEIDKAIEYLKVKKQPVYIEVPKDIGQQPIKYDVYRQGTPIELPTVEENLEEAFDEITTWIKNSKSPVILLGVQIARFGFGNQLIRFCERHSIPVISTLLGKSTISEKHALFAGIYKGNKNTDDKILKLINDSDCLIVFGEMPIDIGMEYQSTKFQKKEFILCSTEKLRVKTHLYCNILFSDFCTKFFKSDLGKKDYMLSDIAKIEKFDANQNIISNERFYQFVNYINNNNFKIVSDVQECLNGASNILVYQNQFISPNFYTNQPFALPAAIGVQLANKDYRPIVILGEKSFKSSFLELKTVLQNNLNPIIFVLKYPEEQLNDTQDWCYNKISELISGLKFCEVVSEKELETASKNAFASNCCNLIYVHLS